MSEVRGVRKEGRTKVQESRDASPGGVEEQDAGALGGRLSRKLET